MKRKEYRENAIIKSWVGTKRLLKKAAVMSDKPMNHFLDDLVRARAEEMFGPNYEEVLKVKLDEE